MDSQGPGEVRQALFGLPADSLLGQALLETAARHTWSDNTLLGDAKSKSPGSCPSPTEARRHDNRSQHTVADARHAPVRGSTAVNHGAKAPPPRRCRARRHPPLDQGGGDHLWQPAAMRLRSRPGVQRQKQERQDLAGRNHEQPARADLPEQQSWQHREGRASERRQEQVQHVEQCKNGGGGSSSRPGPRQSPSPRGSPSRHSNRPSPMHPPVSVPRDRLFAVGTASARQSAAVRRAQASLQTLGFRSAYEVFAVIDDDGGKSL